jgi:Lipocalin-like domain
MKSRIWLVLIGFLAFACSKKDDPTPVVPDQQIVGTWILNDLASTDPDFQSSGQILIGSEWTFNNDKTFLIKASVSGIDLSFPGTWSLSADGKTLTVTASYGGTPGASSMTIIALTATQLVVEESTDGVTSTYTFSAKP